jgi:hypothetical protein
MPELQENDVLLCAKDRKRGAVLRWRRLKPTLLKSRPSTLAQRAKQFATERSHGTSNQTESKNEGENHGQARRKSCTGYGRK